jgi:hypothetical protein
MVETSSLILRTIPQGYIHIPYTYQVFLRFPYTHHQEGNAADFQGCGCGNEWHTILDAVNIGRGVWVDLL